MDLLGKKKNRVQTQLWCLIKLHGTIRADQHLTTFCLTDGFPCSVGAQFNVTLASHRLFISSPALRFISSPGNGWSFSSKRGRGAGAVQLLAALVHKVPSRSLHGDSGGRLCGVAGTRASQRGAPGACVCMLGSHSELTSARHRPRVPPQRSPLGEAARPAPTQPLLG